MVTTASAQQFLAIDAIREDVVVLKNGGLRVVLMCSSFNFALKSTDEQDAIVFQYQNFLNALDFPLQIIIHSRRLNIAPYLEALKNRRKEEFNDLLKVQISEYIEFIGTFVASTNIMSKTFYIVVPFTPAIIGKRGILDSTLTLLGIRKKQEQNGTNSFEEKKNQLWQRAETIMGGLQRIGVRAAPLDTEELIELFYGLYNPTEFEKTARASES